MRQHGSMMHYIVDKLCKEHSCDLSWNKDTFHDLKFIIFCVISYKIPSYDFVIKQTNTHINVSHTTLDLYVKVVSMNCVFFYIANHLEDY